MAPKSTSSFADEPVKDVHWDKERGILNYTIPGDSLLKIRVGSADGPIYRTLVNLEERKGGKNQELWDGMDESGLIDLRDFGKLYFCIDALPRSTKDLVLSVKLIRKQPSSLALDINEEDKKWFCKDGIEIMVFLDKKLIKIKRAKALPCTLNLGRKIPHSGIHLLTLNVWSGDHTSVAYKNLITPLRPGKIAYCQRHKGFWQVWTANLDGSRPCRLTKSGMDKRYPSFSPQGERIAYVTNEGELWIMDVNGRNKRKIPLPIHASQPRWSPHGKRIVFVSYQDLYHGDSELWEVDLETLKLKKFISRPWMQYDPCCSPNGTNIIFTDGPELYAQEICKLDLKTGDVIQLTENGPYDYDMQPVYSPDGKTIVYASNQGGNYDIWIMDKFGRKPHNLTRNSAHDIMPHTDDSRRIFFLSDRSGVFEVWRMNIDTTDLCQVTKTKKDKQDLTVHTALR